MKWKFRTTFFSLSLKQEQNVKIIAIGVGMSVDKAELLKIANGKEDNVVQVAEFSKLISKIQEILKLSCASRRLNTK